MPSQWSVDQLTKDKYSRPLSLFRINSFSFLDCCLHGTQSPDQPVATAQIATRLILNITCESGRSILLCM